MDNDVVVALIVSVPPTLAAIAGIVIASINAGKNNKKLTEIHTLTNSNLSKVTANLEVANETIDGLNKLVNLLEKEKVEVSRK